MLISVAPPARAHGFGLHGATPFRFGVSMYVARPVRIGVTLPPYYSLVREIVRRYADIVVLDQQTYGNPDAISADAAEQLKGIDIIIYEGTGDDDFIVKALEAQGISRQVALVSMSEDLFVSPAPGAEAAGVRTRPYLSIGNTTQQLYAIANSLLQYDPANSMAYRLNTRDYATQLRTLKSVYSESLFDLPPATITAVTLGGGFDLLLGEFDIQISEVFPAPDGTGVENVMDFAPAIKAGGAQVVFSAVPLSDDARSALASATGCVVRNMTTMIDAPFAAETYENDIRQNLAAITEAVRAVHEADTP